MTRCGTCGKPQDPGDALGCITCMDTVTYVSTIEKRRDLMQKANRKGRSQNTRRAGDERNRLRDGDSHDTGESCRVSTDADATPCRRDASKAVGEARS